VISVAVVHAGEDTAVINAIGNSMGNAWGLLVPLLSVYGRARPFLRS
jgi:hypothetical protein